VSDNGHGPEGHSHEPPQDQHDPEAEVRPFEVQIVGMVAETRALQKGSKFSIAPIPTMFDLETSTDQEGTEWIIYVFHDPRGVQRYPFPKHVAEVHHERLGKLINKPRIEVAKEVPPFWTPPEH
jgi:hypothetical protein